MYKLVCFIFTLFGAAAASPAANRYVESVIFGPLQTELRLLSLQPAALPDFQSEFKTKVLLVKTKGTAEYKKGQLIGLGNIARYGECFGPTFSFGRSIVNCTIGFENLTTTHKASVKLGKLPKVPASVTANVTRTLLFAGFSAPPTSSFGQLEKLEFRMVGQINPKYSGLGQLSKYLKFLNDGYKSNVSADLVTVINEQFRHALNRAATQIQFPR